MSETPMTKQILLTRRSPAYWRVTFNHPPLNIVGPDAIDRCISNANSGREKRRQLGADDERPQQGGGMAETPRDPGKVVEQFVDRVRAPVGERTLEVVPHELVGIELRRVRGEALHVQAGMAREE